MTGAAPTAGVAGPHGDRPVVTAGAPRGAAEAVVVALHGRGATAQGVVNLLEPVARHGVTFVAPAAERSRWFPLAAGAPRDRNEPHRSSAVAVVDALVTDAVDRLGVSRDRVVVLGFSQGACVAAEHAVEHPSPGPVVVLSGSLLGPTVDADRHANDHAGAGLDGAPVLCAVGREDPHVPVQRVRATAAVLRALGGDVTERVSDGVGHAVSDDAFAWIGDLLDRLVDD
jgi:phospholipase/carboxylesterase